MNRASANVGLKTREVEDGAEGEGRARAADRPHGAAVRQPRRSRQSSPSRGATSRRRSTGSPSRWRRRRRRRRPQRSGSVSFRSRGHSAWDSTTVSPARPTASCSRRRAHRGACRSVRRAEGGGPPRVHREARARSSSRRTPAISATACTRPSPRSSRSPARRSRARSGASSSGSSRTTSSATARSSRSSTDDTVTEVMVNGPEHIYVERAGKIERTNARFVDDAHLMRIIDKIVSQIGRRVDEASPMVDARLPDGSRVNAIIPPLALTGPTLTIRKFSRDPYTINDLIPFGTMSARAAQFLGACVQGQAQHPHLRRNRHRQDDDAERGLGVHPRRRAHRHDRGRRRAPAAAGARDHARVAPAEHRGQRRGQDPRARPQRAAHAPRPHHRRRGPRRGDARHAPGDEHGPRGLADDDPRELAARRARRASRRSC